MDFDDFRDWWYGVARRAVVAVVIVLTIAFIVAFLQDR